MVIPLLANQNLTSTLCTLFPKKDSILHIMATWYNITTAPNGIAFTVALQPEIGAYMLHY